MSHLTWAIVAYGSISTTVMAAVLVGAIVRIWRDRSEARDKQTSGESAAGAREPEFPGFPLRRGTMVKLLIIITALLTGVIAVLSLTQPYHQAVAVETHQ